MHFPSTLFTAAAAATIAFTVVTAQSPTSTSGPASPSGSVKAHVIKVGDEKGSLTFSPDSMTVGVGELVQFQFYPRNHSVAPSTFDNPCQPLSPGGSSGFWSGFMPVSAGSATIPVFTILINDTKPLWYYCATGRHCQSGMAGVINPPTGGGNRTLEAYKSAAANVPAAGVPLGSGSGGSTSGGGSSGGSGGGSGNSTSGSTVTPSSSANPSSTGGSGSSGAVEVLARGWVAVVVGALAGLVAVV